MRDISKGIGQSNILAQEEAKYIRDKLIAEGLYNPILDTTILSLAGLNASLKSSLKKETDKEQIAARITLSKQSADTTAKLYKAAREMADNGNTGLPPKQNTKSTKSKEVVIYSEPD